tara:strand:- start:11906 stop:13294 length:1389 start_codon:yes stop_codon:yes gene_type:complete
MRIKFIFSLLVLLTFIKILAIFLTSFSLFGDEAQYWLWSRTLDFGYLSKPPFLAWALFVHTSLLGSSFEAVKFFPIFFYIFTSVVFYVLCRRLEMKKNIALFSAFSFFVIPAVSISSFLVSTDVVLLFFWIVSLIVLLQIRKNPSLINFIILGILLGLAFLSKYAAVYFFICLLVNIFFDKAFRNSLISHKLGLFVFVVVFIIVIFPNIYWNAINDWLTFSHTSDNANFQNIKPNLLRGFYFIIIQAIMIGPFLVLMNIINIKNILYDKENIFLLSFSVPIILIVFIESVLVRANANWAAPGLICLLVFLIRILPLNKNYVLFLNFFINYFICFIFFILVAISSNLQVFKRISGVQDFNFEVNKILGEGSIVVVSDRLLYSTLAYENKNKKIKFLMPLAPDQKISKHFQISSSLSKEISENFLYIGDPSEISYLKNENSVELVKELYPKFSPSPLKIYEVIF